jgi:hypothetical protein
LDSLILCSKIEDYNSLNFKNPKVWCPRDARNSCLQVGHTRLTELLVGVQRSGPHIGQKVQIFG